MYPRSKRKSVIMISFFGVEVLRTALWLEGTKGSKCKGDAEVEVGGKLQSALCRALRAQTDPFLGCLHCSGQDRLSKAEGQI